MTSASFPHRTGARTGSGGVAARRAVVRWALRLFRREWRQQLLIVVLLAGAVAATIVAIAVATNAPSSPDATFGSASDLLTIAGPDPNLATDLAAIHDRIAAVDLPAHHGAIDVIENQPLDVAGSVSAVDLRAQDPHGIYGTPMLRLVSGRFPTSPGEVAVTSGVQSLFSLRTGGVWHQGSRTWRVTGIVENPTNLHDDFALVAPGQLAQPTEVTILYDAGRCTTLACAQKNKSRTWPGGAYGTSRQAAVGNPNRLGASTFLLVLAVFGLIFIGLVAVAAFTMMAQRRLRSLAMLAALGASDRNVRLVTVAGGAAVGVAGAIVGAATGLGVWIVYAPRLQASVGHVIDPSNLPWWLIGVAIALAVVAPVVASWGPARSAARIPIVAGLSGRPAQPAASRRAALAGVLLLAVGVGCLASAGGWSELGVNGLTGGWTSTASALSQGQALGNAHDQLQGGLLLIGIATITIGALLLAPWAVAFPAAATRYAPVSVRFAVRDLGRYRARSGAAVAAVSFAVLLAALGAILATASYSNPLAFVGPNLASNQLIVYAPRTIGRGVEFISPGGAATPSEQAAAQSAVSSLAASLHATFVLPLESAGRTRNTTDPEAPEQTNQRATLWQVVRTGTVPREEALAEDNRNYVGALYVATPALLRDFGIDPKQVDPTTDILTSRAGLATVPHLELVGQGDVVTHMNPPGHEVAETHLCPPASCIAHPKIQTISRLPTGTSAPNTVITEHAVRALGQQLIADGWLVQTPQALTAAQTNTARRTALAVGARIESPSGTPSLTQVRGRLAAAGLLVALAVVGLIAGLIRSETASELRTLTAAGASSTTRRNLTAVTTGTIALLGAVLGTAIAYLAVIAWAHSSLATTLSPVPIIDLLALLVGLPLLAGIGGWLLAGREPRAISRQPLE